MKLPEIRTKDIVIQEFEKEMLIYDLLLNKAFLLNQTSAIIYRACGENKTFASLQVDYKFSKDLIYLCLDELKKQNLIENDSYILHFNSINRREIIRKFGMTSMIALPLVSSLIAPNAVNAASVCVNPGGRPPGASTSYSCSGTTASCTTTCRTDFLAQGDCCSGNSELQSGCEEFTPCPCICAS